MTITVTDVNETPEFPADETVARSVAENTATGENIGAPVAATDGDGDTLTYTLGGDDAGAFYIVETSGQLLTKTPLDYETKPSYMVTVTATDPSDASNTIDVTITVNNLEEQGTVELSSLQPQVDTQLTATLTDPDSSVSNLTWEWESSSDQSAWTAIDGATSESYTPIDNDVDKYLQATASYTDGQGSGKTAQEKSINLVQAAPATNSKPEFSAETATRQVDENTEAGQDIGDPVAAADEDRDPLTYTLGGTDAASFDIDTTSGQLRTKAALDYETKSSYTVTVTANDLSNESDTITLTITVTDVNDAPEFPDSETGARRVAENTAAGEDIGDRVAAADDDGDTLTYTLGGTNAASFDIDTATGQLRTNAALDYETKSSYTVTVTANDLSNESDTITLTITVTDVNDAPEFPDSETGARRVAENTAAGEDIGDRVAAADDDGDSLTYTLGGDDAASFNIVESSGQLQTKDALDYKTKSSYSVTVSVRDSKDADGNSDTATDDTITVTITVTDVDESPAPPPQTPPPPPQRQNPPGGGNSPPSNGNVVPPNPAPKSNQTPEFTEGGSAGRSVAENTATGVNIGDPVAATDDDNDALTYSLGGADAASFAIDTASGQLRTKAPLDHEAKSSYSVTVSVRDSKDASGSSDTATDDTITATITVTDVEEAPEFPASETGARSVAENTAAGVNIGDPVAAADDDGDTLTYTLGGTDAASFAIDTASGQLRTKAPLDHETKSSYSVTVSVRDSKDAGGNSDAATDETITVTITRYRRGRDARAVEPFRW